MIGVSLNTIARLEQGKQGTAIVHVFAVLQRFGELAKLQELLLPDKRD